MNISGLPPLDVIEKMQEDKAFKQARSSERSYSASKYKSIARGYNQVGESYYESTEEQDDVTGIS